MGVFSRFRRKAAEASTEDAAAAALTTESEDAAVAADEAGTAVGTAPPAGSESAAPEGVEIPKQQSAEKAADSEAGEGARK
ncbi:gliding motility protein [Streptomyces sp. NPDC085665]|uniref:gliding motility protein n=1 Tax=Streptomyces sp. NPDC085665 TaxID=3365735 RepID=UPI0037D8CDC2